MVWQTGPAKPVEIQLCYEQYLVKSLFEWEVKSKTRWKVALIKGIIEPSNNERV